MSVDDDFSFGFANFHELTLNKKSGSASHFDWLVRETVKEAMRNLRKAMN
jgi:hypothetical protein